MIADKSPLPLLLYLNPGPGADVGIEATVAITKLDKVKYVKESSRNLARVMRLIVEVDHAGHARYFTTMQMLLATLMLGGSGATMPPPGCYIAAKIIDAFNAKDYEQGSQAAARIRAVPVQVPGQGTGAGDEGGDGADRHSARRSLSAVPRLHGRREKGAGRGPEATSLFRKDA